MKPEEEENVFEVEVMHAGLTPMGQAKVDTLSIRAAARPCAELKGRIPCDLRDFTWLRSKILYCSLGLTFSARSRWKEWEDVQ